MIKLNSVLVEIKDFNEHWYNNGHSSTFGLPYGKNVKYGNNIKTPISVDCLDNRRRRVYMNNTFESYTLYVNMNNEKVMLCDPMTLKPIGWHELNKLIKQA